MKSLKNLCAAAYSLISGVETLVQTYKKLDLKDLLLYLIPT